MPASLLHNKKCEANNNSKVRNGIMKALEENTREFNIYIYIYMNLTYKSYICI